MDPESQKILFFWPFDVIIIDYWLRAKYLASKTHSQDQMFTHLP